MSDSDDDLPISDLIRKRKAKQPADANASTKAPAAKKSSTSIKKESTFTAKTSSSSSTSTTTVYYEESDKGLLIQRLLQRWWYAIVWPAEGDIAAPPAGYEPLDGFKGVFISTRTDSLGSIMDLRNKGTCPSFRNFNEYHAEKLQKLCVVAYSKQMEVLEEHEGPGTKLLRELKSELREVKKINPDAAEKDAAKYKKRLSAR
jgi:hypothetical protein